MRVHSTQTRALRVPFASSYLKREKAVMHIKRHRQVHVFRAPRTSDGIMSWCGVIEFVTSAYTDALRVDVLRPSVHVLQGDVKTDVNDSDVMVHVPRFVLPNEVNYVNHDTLLQQLIWLLRTLTYVQSLHGAPHTALAPLRVPDPSGERHGGSYLLQLLDWVDPRVAADAQVHPSVSMEKWYNRVRPNRPDAQSRWVWSTWPSIKARMSTGDIQWEGETWSLVRVVSLMTHIVRDATASSGERNHFHQVDDMDRAVVLIALAWWEDAHHHTVRAPTVPDAQHDEGVNVLTRLLKGNWTLSWGGSSEDEEEEGEDMELLVGEEDAGVDDDDDDATTAWMSVLPDVIRRGGTDAEALRAHAAIVMMYTEGSVETWARVADDHQRGAGRAIRARTKDIEACVNGTHPVLFEEAHVRSIMSSRQTWAASLKRVDVDRVTALKDERKQLASFPTDVEQLNRALAHAAGVMTLVRAPDVAALLGTSWSSMLGTLFSVMTSPSSSKDDDGWWVTGLAAHLIESSVSKDAFVRMRVLDSLGKEAGNVLHSAGAAMEGFAKVFAQIGGSVVDGMVPALQWLKAAQGMLTSSMWEGSRMWLMFIHAQRMESHRQHLALGMRLAAHVVDLTTSRAQRKRWVQAARGWHPYRLIRTKTSTVKESDVLLSDMRARVHELVGFKREDLNKAEYSAVQASLMSLHLRMRRAADDAAAAHVTALTAPGDVAWTELHTALQHAAGETRKYVSALQWCDPSSHVTAYGWDVLIHMRARVDVLLRVGLSDAMETWTLKGKAWKRYQLAHRVRVRRAALLQMMRPFWRFEEDDGSAHVLPLWLRVMMEWEAAQSESLDADVHELIEQEHSDTFIKKWVLALEGEWNVRNEEEISKRPTTTTYMSRTWVTVAAWMSQWRTHKWTEPTVEVAEMITHALKRQTEQEYHATLQAQRGEVWTWVRRTLQTFMCSVMRVMASSSRSFASAAVTALDTGVYFLLGESVWALARQVLFVARIFVHTMERLGSMESLASWVGWLYRGAKHFGLLELLGMGEGVDMSPDTTRLSTVLHKAASVFAQRYSIEMMKKIKDMLGSAWSILLMFMGPVGMGVNVIISLLQGAANVKIAGDLASQEWDESVQVNRLLATFLSWKEALTKRALWDDGLLGDMMRVQAFGQDKEVSFADAARSVLSGRGGASMMESDDEASGVDESYLIVVEALHSVMSWVQEGQGWAELLMDATWTVRAATTGRTDAWAYTSCGKLIQSDRVLEKNALADVASRILRWEGWNAGAAYMRHDWMS
jgi:hypothetical protein